MEDRRGRTNLESGFGLRSLTKLDYFVKIFVKKCLTKNLVLVFLQEVKPKGVKDEVNLRF